MTQVKTTPEDNPAQGKVDYLKTQPSSDTTNTPVIPENTKPTRKERKEAQDRESLRVNAQKYGVDIDHPAKEELTDDYKTRLLNATETAGGKDLASKISGFANMLAPPPKSAVPAIDLKAQLDAEKRKRRARFSDALTAFGEGLQGRTANPDNFVSNRIQRQQDKEFQNYKDATEKNANTKWAWENKNTNDTMDWIDEQLKEQGIRQDKKDNLERLRDQLEQEQANKDRDFKQRGDHYKAMENKPTGLVEKSTLPTIVKTSKSTHKLTPDELDFNARQAMNKAESLYDKNPGIFTRTPILDRSKHPTGEYNYGVNGKATREDLAGANLEDIDNPAEPQPEQSPKGDPLGLGFDVKAAPQVQPKQNRSFKLPGLGVKGVNPQSATQKHSTGGLY